MRLTELVENWTVFLSFVVVLTDNSLIMGDYKDRTNRKSRFT